MVMVEAKIMNQLRVEHRNMTRLLSVLDAQLDRLADSNSIDYTLMMGILTYITEYPDVYHHPKEDLLFSHWLARDNDADAEAVVEELSFEHRSIAHSGIFLLELLRSTAPDVTENRAQLSTVGRRYIENQRKHIKKEESSVFPKVTAALLDEDWQAIDTLLAAPNDPLFGKTIGEPFRSRYAQIRQLVELE